MGHVIISMRHHPLQQSVFPKEQFQLAVTLRAGITKRVEIRTYTTLMIAEIISTQKWAK